MTQLTGWTHTFRTLGFAFAVIGVISRIVGFIAQNTPINCPASGCNDNAAPTIACGLFPSRLTMILARIRVVWTVKIESKREDRESL